jgi:hypothetical protein
LSKSLLSNSGIGIEIEASTSASHQPVEWVWRTAGDAALATKPAMPSAYPA